MSRKLHPKGIEAATDVVSGLLADEDKHGMVPSAEITERAIGAYLDEADKILPMSEAPQAVEIEVFKRGLDVPIIGIFNGTEVIDAWSRRFPVKLDRCIGWRHLRGVPQ